ncbi:hypothetical protein [Luteibacter sp. RCC_6_2]|uniref:hypothetical protein n=1 Tax=Luteibacter sp. RCC_6_2 TaxID=3239223 RepID=UPI003524CBA4
MIREYKLYHGAVLADIVAMHGGAVTIRPQEEGGRLLNYVLNEQVGLQVKYATQRLRPWPFSFSSSHISSLSDLLSTYKASFVVLVCHTDGMVAVEASDVVARLDAEQGWLRVERKKHEMYRVHGPGGEFPGKYKITVEPIVEALWRLARKSR